MTDKRRRGPVVAEPLPECELCEQPTKREAWEENGHLCTPCVRGIADTVRMLPVGGVVDLDRVRARRRASEALNVAPGYAVDDLTAWVERYVPPVPGQLRLDDLSGSRDESGDR